MSIFLCYALLLLLLLLHVSGPSHPSSIPPFDARRTYCLDSLLLDVPDETMADLGVDEVGEEEDCGWRRVWMNG
jgi:hypothetical protein